MPLEAQVVDYTEDWLEEEEGENDYSDDRVVVVVLHWKD
jgi:hypothetical protein